MSAKLNSSSAVQLAIEELPADFAELVEEVPIEIHDRPTAAVLRGMKLSPGSLLLGLYRGRPRTQRSVEDSGTLPDVIYLFQANIESVSHSEAELHTQIRKTLLHEIGHHFGMDEDDLDKLGYG